MVTTEPTKIVLEGEETERFDAGMAAVVADRAWFEAHPFRCCRIRFASKGEEEFIKGLVNRKRPNK